MGEPIVTPDASLIDVNASWVLIVLQELKIYKDVYQITNKDLISLDKTSLIIPYK